MTHIERRALIRGGSAALVATALAAAAHPGWAAAPLAAKQAPGFYRFKVGSLEVTVISDSNVAFPADGLWKAPGVDIAASLASEFRPASPALLQLNTVVVNTGDKMVLIDTGTGGKFQSTSGHVIENLAAAGYSPDQVDLIVFTHFHPDHLWGISDRTNGKLLFPNAQFVGTDVEHGFWAAPGLSGKMPAEMKAMVDATQANLALLGQRFSPVKAGAELAPGIHSVDTPGHTPGHTSVLLSSGSDTLLLTGDVIHNAAISLQHPDWPIGFDMDPTLAGKTRAAFLDRVAADKTLVASYHLPFPGVGHIVRDAGTYRWVPVEWVWG